ncbi:MAG: hypothetical protein BWZ10_00914 [candidate division BRC1 bacterium ADurb.BinA364]|nr:MAG: hypothetical protein BWZ10_00914 [candidate division BRC1 bacterium ADurb.BinA364]
MRKLAQNPYQLVLLDLEMPGVDVAMVSGAIACFR